MKKKVDEKLSDFLNIESDIKHAKKINAEIIQTINSDVEVLSSRDDDILDDYKFRRMQLYKLIEKSELALDNIMHVARDSDSPRAYEVVAQMLKTNGELIKELTQLQIEMNKVNNEKDGTGPSKVVNNNSVFVGNTNELLEMLRGKNRE